MKYSASFLLALVLLTSGCVSSLDDPSEEDQVENVYGVENVSEDWNSSRANHVLQTYLRTLEDADSEDLEQVQEFVHPQSNLNHRLQQQMEEESDAIDVSHTFIGRISPEDLKYFDEEFFIDSSGVDVEDKAAFAFSRTTMIDTENIETEIPEHEIPDATGGHHEALMVKDEGTWYVTDVSRELRESHSDTETIEESEDEETETQEQQEEDIFEEDEEQDLNDNINEVEVSESEIDQEVTLTGVEGFEWRPDEMTFGEGETVKFNIVSEERDQDFEFTDETESVFVPEGEEETITVRFEEPGSYEYRCAVFGPGGMKGTVTVE